MRENLFMNSRDRLRNGQLKKQIESKLENVISKHEGLRELREKQKREILADQISDDKPLAELLESLLKNSKSLSAFLIDGKRISNPFKTKRHSARRHMRANRFLHFLSQFTLIHLISHEWQS